MLGFCAHVFAFGPCALVRLAGGQFGRVFSVLYSRLRLVVDHSKMVNTLSKLGSQHNENDMVLKELELVDEDAKVFKLIGPVLIKQDLDEAKANVEKRLQYIQDEM